MLSRILRTLWEKRRKHSAQQNTDTERARLVREAQIQFGTAATTHHTARGGSRFPFHVERK